MFPSETPPILRHNDTTWQEKNQKSDVKTNVGISVYHGTQYNSTSTQNHNYYVTQWINLLVYHRLYISKIMSTLYEQTWKGTKIFKDITHI